MRRMSLNVSKRSTIPANAKIAYALGFLEAWVTSHPVFRGSNADETIQSIGEALRSEPLGNSGEADQMRSVQVRTKRKYTKRAKVASVDEPRPGKARVKRPMRASTKRLLRKLAKARWATARRNNRPTLVNSSRKAA